MNQWIRAARTHAKLTQTELGEHLGVSKGNVSAWENGHHEASHAQLVRIGAVTKFPEPLPGVADYSPDSADDQPLEAVSWPFPKIDERKVSRLDEAQRGKLEDAMLIAAGLAGLDVGRE